MGLALPCTILGPKAFRVLTHLCVVLLLLTAISSNLTSQETEYHIQIFDEDHGIRPGTITKLARDRDGFLWILCPRYIQRFDGRSIKTFNPGSGLEHIFCDDQGQIWVTAIDQVYRYENALQAFTEVPVISQDSVVRRGKVFSLPGGRNMLGSTTGFYEFDTIQQAFVKAIEDLPVPPPYGRRDFAWHDDAIFFRRGSMLYRYNTDNGALDSLAGGGLHSLYPLSKDSVLAPSWFLSAYWLDFASVEKFPAYLPPDYVDGGSAQINVRCVIDISKRQFLVSSREGLFKYDVDRKQLQRVKLFHKGTEINTKDLIFDMKYDEEGYVWLASQNWIGRMPLHGQTFNLLRLQQTTGGMPLGIDDVRGFTEDPSDNIWIATGNGFVRWNRTKSEIEHFTHGHANTNALNFPSIRGIHHDGRNLLVGQSQYGIWIFDPVQRKYRRPAYINEETKYASEHDFIDRFTALRNGDVVSVCRDRLYLLKRKANDYVMSILDVLPSRENSDWGVQGRDGEVWIGTTEGMHLLDSSLQYLQRVELPLDNQYVNTAAAMSDGRLLISVVGEGLYTSRYDGTKVDIEKMTSHFDQTYIMSMVEDGNGIIWVASEDGIYRYAPQQDKVKLFDHTDNVQGYRFHGNSGFIARDGFLFFGGANGINYFNPGDITFRHAPVKVFIESVWGGPQDTVSYPLNQKVILPYHQRSISFEFISPYYYNPDRVTYRYRLIGLDPEWKYIGPTTRLRFSFLPPGDYTLLLEAGLNNTGWGGHGANFTFRVRPPFWATWWFTSLMFIGGTGALWIFVRNRNRRLEQKQEELEAEQAVNYFSRRMAEQTTIDGLLWDVARNCIGRLHFEDCVIYLADHEEKYLVQCAAFGPKNPSGNTLINPIRLPIGEGITGTVALTGRAEIVNDTSKDPRYIVDDVRRNAEIAVPMIADGQVVGVIDSEHSKKGYFTQRHLSIVTTIASLCAAKIIKVKAENEKRAAEQKLMETRQQMADIEMQALRAQMNPHFIFNCLNSINRYIVKSDQATASLYLTRFAKLIRLILDNSNARTVPLANELEALRLYIEMESIRFEKQFTYAITVEENVVPDHVFVPPMVIQPFVENAIWHGLLHKEEAGHLDILVRRLGGNGVLECTITDNGVGRERAAELKSKSASPNKSLGMKLTENRLAILNERSAWNASVVIEDLHDHYGEAAGTKVILTIPVDS